MRDLSCTLACAVCNSHCGCHSLCLRIRIESVRTHHGTRLLALALLLRMLPGKECGPASAVLPRVYMIEILRWPWQRQSSKRLWFDQLATLCTGNTRTAATTTMHLHTKALRPHPEKTAKPAACSHRPMSNTVSRPNYMSIQCRIVAVPDTPRAARRRGHSDRRAVARPPCRTHISRKH